jgi:hypothetical protein
MHIQLRYKTAEISSKQSDNGRNDPQDSTIMLQYRGDSRVAPVISAQTSDSLAAVKRSGSIAGCLDTYEIIRTKTCIQAHRNGTHLSISSSYP